MASRHPRKAQSASAGGSPTVGVLVVDNDQSVRSVLRDVLTDEFMMFEASDAMEALQKSRSVQPTAILVDLSLPGGIDGQAFIQLYRKDGGSAKLFLLSGSPGADRVGRALGIEVIAKPFDIEELLTMIRAGTSEPRSGR